MRFDAHRDRRVLFQQDRRLPPAGCQAGVALAYAEPLATKGCAAGTCTKLFLLLWMQLMAMEKMKSA